MAAMTKSEITIKNVSYENLGIIPESFRRLGIKLEQRGDAVSYTHLDVYKRQMYLKLLKVSASLSFPIYITKAC